MKHVKISIIFLLFTLSSVPNFAQNCNHFISKGDDFYSNFEFENALRQYLECQRNDSKNFVAHYKSGLCLYQLQRFYDAKLFFEEAIKLDTTHVLAHFHLSNCESELGNLNAQTELLEKVVEMSPQNIYYRTQYADHLAQIGKKNLAILEYNKILDLSKNDIPTLVKLAEQYFDYQEYETADSLLNMAYLISPVKSVRLLRAKAETEYKLKNDSSAIVTIDELKAKGDSSIYFLKLQAAAYHNVMEFEKAIEVGHLVEKKLIPKKDEYVHYLLASSYQKLEMADSALSQYNKAIQTGTSGNLGLYYGRVADILEENHQLSEAIQAYKSQLFYVKDPTIYYSLGLLSDQYYADKNIAIHFFQQFLNKAPREMETYINYAENRIIAIREIIHQSQVRPEAGDTTLR